MSSNFIHFQVSLFSLALTVSDLQRNRTNFLINWPVGFKYLGNTQKDLLYYSKGKWYCGNL